MSDIPKTGAFKFEILISVIPAEIEPDTYVIPVGNENAICIFVKSFFATTLTESNVLVAPHGDIPVWGFNETNISAFVAENKFEYPTTSEKIKINMKRELIIY